MPKIEIYVWFLTFLGLMVLPGCQSPPEPTDDLVLSMPLITEDSIVSRAAGWIEEGDLTLEQQQQNELLYLIMDRGWDLDKTETSLFYHMLQPGDSHKPSWGDLVVVHYTGYHLDGRIFDSSRLRNKPIEFYIGNMIPGWNQAVPMLGQQGKGIFLIPTHMAYGEKGLSPKIGPNEHLIFEIELLEIKQE